MVIAQREGVRGVVAMREYLHGGKEGLVDDEEIALNSFLM
jgi:hypothetical protein